jgi:hypothetical protein
MLVTGDINVLKCASCGYVAQMASPLLYNYLKIKFRTQLFKIANSGMDEEVLLMLGAGIS